MSNKSLAKPHKETCILVTGGAGFIGSHTCVELLERGYRVVVVDDLSNSSETAIERVRAITGTGVPEQRDRLTFYQENVLDRNALERVFSTHDIDAVIHFAGFKAVGESVEKPLEYYWNNVAGTLVLCDVARGMDARTSCSRRAPPSTASPSSCPSPKNARSTRPRTRTARPRACSSASCPTCTLATTNGTSCFCVTSTPSEHMKAGLSARTPRASPNNLLPYVAQVAVGKLECVGVFGDDYPTPDGTGVRDYIHVVDLARGHVAALDWMGGKVGTGAPSGPGAFQGEASADGSRRGVGIFNLGTGKGSSVLDVIHAFERACGREVSRTKSSPAAPETSPRTMPHATRHTKSWGWVAQYDLDRMCADSWRWQSMNPDGYATAS